MMNELAVEHCSTDERTTGRVESLSSKLMSESEAVVGGDALCHASSRQHAKMSILGVCTVHL